jgi:hypothetical protein
VIGSWPARDWRIGDWAAAGEAAISQTSASRTQAILYLWMAVFAAGGINEGAR